MTGTVQDSVTDKYTYTLCKRDSLILAVNGNISALEIYGVFFVTWEGKDLCTCLYGLVKVVMHDSHHTVCLITGVETLSRRRCSRPRGEGADRKTRNLALLTPDKLTSHGASCSASGACWAEQLSVEPRRQNEGSLRFANKSMNKQAIRKYACIKRKEEKNSVETSVYIEIVFVKP